MYSLAETDGFVTDANDGWTDKEKSVAFGEI